MTEDGSHRTQKRTRETLNNAMGELREAAKGNLPKDVPIHPHTGLVRDDDLREMLSLMSSAHDEPIEETRLFDDLVRDESTRVASTAVREGNLSQVEYMTGWQGYENDVSGIQTIYRLESWLLDRERAKMIYLAGHQGNGKTDFAHLLIEVVTKALDRRESREPELASNIPSSRSTETIQRYDRLRDWFTEGSTDLNKWYIFDEASSELSGYSHDRDKVEEYLSGLIKRMRKNGCNLIIIGHTGMDVHPDIRRLADYVEKPSQKTARVYSSVKRGEGYGHRFDVDRIPPTSLDYDTEDEASWSWQGIEEDVDDGLDPDEIKRMLARRAAFIYEETDWTQKQTAEALSTENIRITQTDVSRAKRGEYGSISA